MRLVRLLSVLGLALVMASAGCATVLPAPDDTRNLRISMRDFHKNLRWARYEHAADLVDSSAREGFLGRYDELGKDFHIVSLDVKDVKVHGKEAEVDIEQQWYKEPDMSVKTDRFIEVWKKTDKGWLMHERVKKSEYERRKKAKLKRALERDKAAESRAGK